MLQSVFKYKSKKAWFMLGLLSLSSVFISAPSLAQGDVENRLLRMENELQTLNRAVYRGEINAPAAGFGDDPAAQAGAEVRLQQLDSEMRNLRGTLEEQSHAIRQLETKLDKALNDMQMRFSDLEKAAPAPAAANQSGVETFTWSANDINAKDAPTTIKSLAPTEKASGSSGDAASMYENAFALLKSGKYEQAGAGFDAFIRQYPNHALTSNAKYWLGETYYVRGNYETSSRIFAEGYKQFPTGTKAPDNLLKLGMSLAGLGNTQDACVAFAQLQKEFSNGAAPVLRRAEQERARLSCS